MNEALKLNIFGSQHVADQHLYLCYQKLTEICHSFGQIGHFNPRPSGGGGSGPQGFRGYLTILGVFKHPPGPARSAPSTGPTWVNWEFVESGKATPKIKMRHVKMSKYVSTIDNSMANLSDS